MNKKLIKNYKNKDYLVLLPDFDYDIKDSVTYSFNNVLMVKSSEQIDKDLKNCFYSYYNYNEEYITNNCTEDYQEIIDYVNKNCKTLVLFDYSGLYRKILPYISKKVKIKWVYRYNMAELTQGLVRIVFKIILEYYDRDIVNEILCLDESSCKVFKNSGYPAEHIILDVERTKSKNVKSNSIGLISSDRDPNHNVYNQLSALKLTKYSKVKLTLLMASTIHFLDFFNIKSEVCDSVDNAMKNNYVNLYINFTFTNIELVLKSMDMGIPCILGNTTIFDNYPKLKEYLVLDSDDDINEIADKINSIKDNKDIILKEYSRFRDAYSKESKKIINKFIK